MFSLERRLQIIETAAGARNVLNVFGRAPWVSIFATPRTESHYGGDAALAHPPPFGGWERLGPR
eukprot:11613901-Alexandrium_andersonii.AAC.1